MISLKGWWGSNPGPTDYQSSELAVGFQYRKHCITMLYLLSYILYLATVAGLEPEAFPQTQPSPLTQNTRFCGISRTVFTPTLSQAGLVRLNGRWCDVREHNRTVLRWYSHLFLKCHRPLNCCNVPFPPNRLALPGVCSRCRGFLPGKINSTPMVNLGWSNAVGEPFMSHGSLQVLCYQNPKEL